jgi:hypothetical protein
MVGDVREHMVQPCLKRDITELGRADHGADRRSAFTTVIGTGEGIVATVDSNATQGSLIRQVFDLDGIVVAVARVGLVRKCIPCSHVASLTPTITPILQRPANIVNAVSMLPPSAVLNESVC